MIRKIFKILLTFIAAILLSAAVLFFLAGMGVFNSLIPGIIQKQASKNINGELRIGSLEGKLFNEIELKDVLLLYRSDTMLYVSTVELRYNLGRLFGKEIRADLIKINKPYLYLEQYADSSWNFSSIMKMSEKTDSAQAGSSWKIDIGTLGIHDFLGVVRSADEDDMIPDSVMLMLQLSARMDGDTLAAEIDSLSIKSLNPDLAITSFRGNFRKAGTLLAWSNLFMKPGETNFYSDGFFDPGNRDSAKINAELEPFNPGDLAGIFPQLLRYPVQDISVSAAGSEERYDFGLGIKMKGQIIEMSGNLEEYKTAPRYSAILSAANIDASEWTGDPGMKTTINGRLEISGSGFDIKQNQVRISGNFKDFAYGGYSLHNTKMSISKTKGNAGGIFDTDVFDGTIRIRFDINRIFDIPAFDISLRYDSINLATFPGQELPETELNGEIQLEGEGTRADDLIANAFFTSNESVVDSTLLGRFSGSGGINRGAYNFMLADFGAPYFILGAEGNGNLDGDIDVSFSFVPLEPGPLLSTFNLPEIDLEGSVEGQISGRTDSLEFNADISLSNISYDTIHVGHFTSVIDGTVAKDFYTGEVSFSAGQIEIGENSVRLAEVDASVNDESIEAEIYIQVNDSLSASSVLRIAGTENPKINIENLNLAFRSMEWSTTHDSASILLNEDNIEVNDLDISSGDQSIRADGIFSPGGEEDITLQISNLDLVSLPVSDFLPFKVAGILNLEAILKGDATNPLINLKVDANRVLFDKYRVDSIRINTNYDNKEVSAEGNLFSDDLGMLTVSAVIPAVISLTDTIMISRDEQTLDLKVSLDSLDLVKVFQLFPIDGISVSGLVDANVSVTNSVSDPYISGEMGLSDAKFAYDLYGIDYDNINLAASIDSSTLAIDSFSVSGGKGKLDVAGYLSLVNTDSLELNDLGFTLKADDFQATEFTGMELNFDTDINVSGTLGQPGFTGNIEINQAKANVDYFTNTFSEKRDDPDPPLLLQALNDTVTIASSDTVSSKFQIGTADILKDLRGKLTIDIPGNTWITGEDMNFELEGSLQAVKETEDVSLFGDLNIKRGYYKLYGRSFDFNRGKMSFTGASDINPVLDFEIVYRFRDIEKELQDLVLNISGRLRQPEYKFTLNDQSLEEKDAISYIIFGKSINQLGEGERSKISGESLAMGAAMTQLSSVIKDVLQESAGVDVFEISGGEEWSSGNVTIGKYVTKNLFLSYERSFDFDKQTKTADTERIMLEYQIIRNFILKATNQEINSGFDFIFRKTWR